MIAGHLQIKNGNYYAVLNCKHRDGKRFPKWVAIGLPDKKGNKRAAERRLDELCEAYNEYGERIQSPEHVDGVEIIDTSAPGVPPQSSYTTEVLPAVPPLPTTALQPTPQAQANGLCGNMLFADYMLAWLSLIEPDVDIVTFCGYCDSVENHIYPYFKQLGITLGQLQPWHLKEFYRRERIGDPQHGKQAKKGTTVVRYHANIHEALEAAVEDGLVGRNVAHKQRPSTDKFVGSFFLPEEALECIQAAEGTPLELAVFFGLFYGLRRSEIVGLKWQNFDFKRNTFTIAHTVTTVSKRGVKIIYCAKDKTKNKSSMRTLPLIPMAREKLLKLKEQQKVERQLFKKSYCTDYLGYVYVNPMGVLIRPNYISCEFAKMLKRNGLRHIRFHDTRHSCASLLLRNGVSMKDIQVWLGHSDYSTTANIYAHLSMDDSKLNSAISLSTEIFGKGSEAAFADKPESAAAGSEERK